ncbi:hypothetical protein [Cupriavidus sp. UME77]|uniref:hypothetical protein n=1 Tax=Cupriavidus sp. UME77 TaxID=1862321 RepID=UPI001602B489|nr:hypothetical protein [Cupriavidus sp. UME77]MBB1634915.1 hypothetical protein [Cupriavidus sp. UME77]
MHSQGKSFRALSVAFAELQKEVRAVTRQVQECAMKQVCDGDDDGHYMARVIRLIDYLIDQADARGRVVCFASAAEFGLSLHHQGERCRQAALNTGSDSVRALYWAAIRRMRTQKSKPAMLSENRVVPITPAGARSGGGMGWTDAPSLTSELCRLCEHLRVDARRESGHDALRPISGKSFRRIGQGLLSEALGYQCNACKAVWTRYKHSAAPFAMWVVKPRQ